MTDRGPGAVRSESARVAILRATADQLVVHGWNRLTIEGIAAAAHVGKPTIYRWWSSKSDLIADALMEGMLQLEAPLPDDGGDLREDLATWLEKMLALAGDPVATATIRYLMAAAAEDEVVGRRFDDANGAMAALATRLEHAKSAGQLDAEVDVADLVDAITGVIILRVLRRAPAAPGDAQRLLRGILPPTDEPSRPERKSEAP